jgi:protein-tyrosine phosphatase
LSIIEEKWKMARQTRFKMLKKQDSVGVACLHGAGRSGMMAAAIGAECGVAPSKAVRYVRRCYTDAVGSVAQEKWVASGTYLT